MNNVASNLEWTTHRENVEHAFAVLGRTSLHGEQLTYSRLTDADIREARMLRSQGVTYQAIADRLGIVISHAYRIVNGHRWKHVE